MDRKHDSEKTGTLDQSAAETSSSRAPYDSTGEASQEATIPHSESTNYNADLKIPAVRRRSTPCTTATIEEETTRNLQNHQTELWAAQDMKQTHLVIPAATSSYPLVDDRPQESATPSISSKLEKEAPAQRVLDENQAFWELQDNKQAQAPFPHVDSLHTYTESDFLGEKAIGTVPFDQGEEVGFEGNRAISGEGNSELEREPEQTPLRSFFIHNSANIRPGAVAVPGPWAREEQQDDNESFGAITGDPSIPGVQTTSREVAPAAAHLVPGEHDLEEQVKASAVLATDMTDEIRDQLRDEIRQELEAQIGAQTVNAQVVREPDNGGDAETTISSEIPSEKPFWKKKKCILLLVVLFLAIIGAVVGALLATSSSDAPSSSRGVGSPNVGNPGAPSSPPPTSSPVEGPTPLPTPLTTEQSTPSPTPPPVIGPTPSPTFRRTPSPTLRQVQLGELQYIGGDFNNDRFGTRVKFSRDGRRLAVGANHGEFARVFQRSGSQFSQLGQDIRGSGTGFGYRLNLNDDGDVLVVGTLAGDQAQVFEYKSGSNRWEQKGQTLSGSGNFGWDVAISSDGNTIAATARLGNYVQVFSYSGTQWQQLGDTLRGEYDGGEFGRSVSLSATGRRVAVGANLSGERGEGQILVYDYFSSTWNQVGQAMEGEAFEDFQGTSVSLSSAGSKLVTSADGNDGGSNCLVGLGLIRAYEFASGSWRQYGQNVYGESCDTFIGAGHISMSSDGNMFVVAAQHYDNSRGKAYVYRYEGSQWVLMDTQTGDNQGDRFGYSVTISGDGSLVAVGAIPKSDNNLKGYVRVYALD